MGQHTAGGPLQTPPALAALLDLVGDHGIVHTLATSYADWGALRRAAGSELGWRLGPKGASLRLPALAPTEQDLPEGVLAVTRYDPAYPQQLLQLPDPPVVVYLRGRLDSDVPRLAVGGADHPSVTGVHVARAAARAAAAQRVPLVATLSGLLGTTALTEAVDAGGRTVAIQLPGFGVAGAHCALADRVLAAGGAVLTATGPRQVPSPGALDLAATLTVGLSDAAVLAEVGGHDTAGRPLAAAAVAAGTFLIVPAPQRAPHTPASAAGIPVLAQARAFSDALFGSSPRIAARVANGLSPADAVVSTPAQLAAAIALGTRRDGPTART